MEDDVPRRVTRGEVDVQRKVADGNLVAFFEPTIGLEGHSSNSITGAVFRQPRDPPTVGLLRPLDRNGQLVGEGLGEAAMVDMTMGQEDLFGRHPLYACGGDELVDVAAGINERTTHGGRTP